MLFQDKGIDSFFLNEIFGTLFHDMMVECKRKVGLAGGSGLVVTMVADFEQTGRQLQENLSFYSESTTANITFHSIRTSIGIYFK